MAYILQTTFLPYYVLNFSQETQKCIYNLYHFSKLTSLNYSSWKTRSYIFYVINIMGADGLATQGARASATTILTMLKRNNSVPAR